MSDMSTRSVPLFTGGRARRFSNPVQPEYSAADLQAMGFDPETEVGSAGSYPFTRGRHKDGYATLLWDMAAYSGISSPEETNARFRHIVSNSEPGRRNTLAIALTCPLRSVSTRIMRWPKARWAGQG